MPLQSEEFLEHCRHTFAWNDVQKLENSVENSMNQ